MVRRKSYSGRKVVATEKVQRNAYMYARSLLNQKVKDGESVNFSDQTCPSSFDDQLAPRSTSGKLGSLFQKCETFWQIGRAA